MTRAPRERPDPLARQLGVVDTTALVVGSILGAGIFAGAGDVAAALPDARWLLLAWVAGGLLSIAGALVNAEMATALPHAGGDYVFLSEAYHPVVGFLAGWGSFFAIQSGTVATLAVSLSQHLAGVVPGAGSGPALPIAVILGSSWLNYRGTLLGARVQTAVTMAKVGAIACFAIASLFATRGLGSSFVAAGGVTVDGFALGLMPILFAYLGWNAPVYVASEIRDPARTLPRSIVAGTVICIALYLGVNLAYVAAMSPAEMAGDPRVAEIAATRLFGHVGGQVIAGLVVVSIAGCLHATILVGPRIVYAMALDGLLAPRLASVHRRHATPHRAIAMQAFVASMLVVFWGTFTQLLTYTTFAIVVVATLDAGAIFALRWRYPGLARPFRAWGYPWVALVYAATNAWLAIMTFHARPTEGWAVLAIVATGVPAYAWWTRPVRYIAK